MSHLKYLFFLIFFGQNYIHTTLQATNLVINEVDANKNVESIIKKLAVGEEEFSLDLFKRISAAISYEKTTYNFMISPFSIWSLLVLIAEGAKGNTLEEILSTLRIKSNLNVAREGYKQLRESFNVNTSTIEVNSLEAAFFDKNFPVDEDYKKVIETIYKTNIAPIDFHNIIDAKTTINNYVKTLTKGHIDNVVDNDDLLHAQMVLVSAIYFRGLWNVPFNKSLTKQESFYDENGNILGNVDMMYNKGIFNYTNVSDLDAHVLELPYGKEKRLSMIIILPKKGTKLTSVIEKLARFGISRIYAEFLKSSDLEDDDGIEVFLPKFSTTSFLTLNIILEEMGIRDVFDALKSDLRKISTSNRFHLSHMLHKAKIEVNEEGTVASAASVGIISNKSSPPRFYANRPFAYIILEKLTNSIVFCGELRNPLLSE